LDYRINADDRLVIPSQRVSKVLFTEEFVQATIAKHPVVTVVRLDLEKLSHECNRHGSESFELAPGSIEGIFRPP
jgi:hypothetical protein